MPTIAYFYGIYVRRYFNDHPPPHFFAEYQGFEVNVSISTGEVIDGKLPRTASRIVKEWALRHQAELLANRERARSSQPLEKIVDVDPD